LEFSTNAREKADKGADAVLIHVVKSIEDGVEVILDATEIQA